MLPSSGCSVALCKSHWLLYQKHVIRGLGATAGSLPGSWGSQGAAALGQLTLSDLSLTETLPVIWGSNLSFPSLTSLQIGSEPFVKHSYISMAGGTLPSQWATPGAFPQLRVLTNLEYSITGVGHVPKAVFQSFALHGTYYGCCICNPAHLPAGTVCINSISIPHV